MRADDCLPGVARRSLSALPGSRAGGPAVAGQRPSLECSASTIGRLSINAKRQNKRHVLFLRGEIDVASAPMLEATIEELCAAGAEEIVLDLSAVEFVDSSGLNAILHGKSLCEHHQCAYSLTPAQRPVERMFDMTGVEGPAALSSAVAWHDPFRPLRRAWPRRAGPARANRPMVRSRKHLRDTRMAMPVGDSPVDLTRRSFAAAGSGDYDLMMSFYGRDSVFDMSGWGLGVHTGPHAIRRFFESWIGSFAEFSMELKEVVDLGSGVTFAVAIRTRSRPARASRCAFATRPSPVAGRRGGARDQLPRTCEHGAQTTCRQRSQRPPARRCRLTRTPPRCNSRRPQRTARRRGDRARRRARRKGRRSPWCWPRA